MKSATGNYHDYLIEEIHIGPRRELNLLTRTSMNEPFAWLRFSAISNYSVVQNWYQSNEQKIKFVNSGKMLIRIESCQCESINFNECRYSVLFDHIDELSFRSRRVQELKHNHV